MKLQILVSALTLAAFGSATPIDDASEKPCTPNTQFCTGTQMISVCDAQGIHSDIMDCVPTEKCAVVFLNGQQIAICVKK